LIVTRFDSMNLSASLRLQKPVSLIYLFRLISISIHEFNDNEKSRSRLKTCLKYSWLNKAFAVNTSKYLFMETKRPFLRLFSPKATFFSNHSLFRPLQYNSYKMTGLTRLYDSQFSIFQNMGTEIGIIEKWQFIYSCGTPLYIFAANGLLY
jgi:hypothetical protein